MDIKKRANQKQDMLEDDIGSYHPNFLGRNLAN